MATAEERLKILRMVQEGKLSAEEGVQLIEAMEPSRRAKEVTASRARQPAPPGPGSDPAQSPGRAPRWFRVRVTDTNTGKTRVNVRLPINLVHAGLKMGARFSPEVQGLDQESLMAFVNSGEIGKLVDVFDEEDGEHVEVFIE
jgi:hypothetical protein